MRLSRSSLFACAVLGAGFVTPVAPALARDPGGPPSSTSASNARTEPSTALERKAPSFSDLKATLDPQDRLAVLEAIHVGLTELADGASYVWHRKNGRIGGSIRPTVSFVQGNGQVCRHIVFQLTLGDFSRQMEGIACREPDKSWSLQG